MSEQPTSKVVVNKEPLYVPNPEEVIKSDNIHIVEKISLFKRQPAEFVFDLSGYGISHALLAEQPIELHSTYLSKLLNVELFGHHHLHAAIGEGNKFNCQDITGYRHRLNYHVDHHPGRKLPMPQITRDGDDYFIDRSQVSITDVIHFQDSLFFATPIEPLNWGMWLLQAMPAASLFLQQKPAKKLIAYVGRPWQRDFLETMGVDKDDIVHQELGVSYKCDELTMLQYSHINLAVSSNEVELFSRLSKIHAPDSNRTANRRIFLSRRTITQQSNGKYRALQNEDEVVSAAESLGFEIIEPERFSLSDQIKIFSEAETVIGLGGAALFNVVFCRPGTRVVSIESSANFVHGHAALFGSLGHRFGFMFGSQDQSDTAPVHKRWTIDVDKLVSILRDL